VKRGNEITIVASVSSIDADARMKTEFAENPSSHGVVAKVTAVHPATDRVRTQRNTQSVHDSVHSQHALFGADDVEGSVMAIVG